MPLLTMGLSLTNGGVLSGTPTSDGHFLITLKVTDTLNRVASVSTTVRVSLERPPATFSPTGSMSITRSGHTATLLLTTGEVLVTGGGNGVPDTTAELYNPATGTFTRTTGNMIDARRGHTATLLGNQKLLNYGKVLIVGSVGTSAELYDPATGKFAATGPMNNARNSPTATLLGNPNLPNYGKVLIVGGNSTSGDLKAELYDPESGKFSNTGSTTTLRTGHTATLLNDGRVLIAGGNGSAATTAELYNPTYGTFTLTAGRMTEPRSGHTATLLASGSQDGSVLIIGTNSSADLYNPNTETFASVGSLRYVGPTPPGNSGYTASLRNDGTVLLAGGYITNPCGSSFFPFSVVGAALFAQESEGFTATGRLNTARDGHTATVLSDGSVLVIGGTQHTVNHPVPNSCQVLAGTLSSAELFKTEGQHTYTLTGYCIAPEPTTPGCARSLNAAACPVGKPAIAPTTVINLCHLYPTSRTTLDNSRGCIAELPNGVRVFGGRCLVQ
jgi:hypothetical protein